MWETIVGTFEFAEDQGLTDVGRSRFHKSHGSQLDPGLFARESSGLNEEVNWAFVARRHPWSLIVVNLPTTTESVGEIIAWTGERTAVINETLDITVFGPKHERGALGLAQMLNPLLFANMEQFSPQISGTMFDDDLSIAPDLTVLGSDLYEIILNPELHIITSWTALISENIASTRQITILRSEIVNR